tara:strand:- start:507 stop:974 length:468 start_codon:yes stop_codon:yes gene_type:complete
MFKKIGILIISLFTLVSCGYNSIYSENGQHNFSISQLEIKGESKINKHIKNSLSRFEKVKKEKDYQIKITSKLNKITLAKDLKGSATDFKIVTSLDLEVIKNNNSEKTEKVSFTENFAIKKTDSNYEQNNYEIIVINNLSKLLLDQVVMYLSTNR